MIQNDLVRLGVKDSEDTISTFYKLHGQGLKSIVHFNIVINNETIQYWYHDVNIFLPYSLFKSIYENEFRSSKSI